MKYTTSQTKAINHEGENILVSASAGSGKTGVLKARVLRKIKSQIDIDQLIILTFTEAAAAEMKSRIIDELNHHQLFDQLVKLDNAVISTFDAFTLRLVKTYHYLLGLPKDVTISDPLLIEMESKKIIESIIQEQYLKQDQDFIEMIQLLFSGNDLFLERGILNLAKEIKKIPNHLSILDTYHDHYQDQMIPEAINHYFSLIKEDLNFLYQEFMNDYHDNYRQFNETADQYLDQCESVYHQLKSAQDFSSLAALLLAFKLPKKPRKPRDFDVWIEPNEVVKKQVLLIQSEIKDVLGSKGDLLASWQETKPRINLMMEMVKSYLMRLKEVQKEKQLFAFGDIADYAITLLEEHDDIRLHYQQFINEILIDEYQDTNDLQDYFVSLIANNNVFMVGDVKQSIYRFRDANPKNFLKRLVEYQTSGEGKAIRLLENFRSNHHLLNTINTLFLELMTESRGGVDYQDNHQLISGYDQTYPLNQKNDPIHCLFYDFETLTSKYPEINRDQVEAKIIAQDIIRKIKARQPIFDGKGFRPITYSDITILVDRKNSFSKYAEILSDYQIPVDIYDRVPFSESEEIIFVKLMIQLLGLVYNQDKHMFKQCLYGVARSFVYQIPDQEIIHFFVNEEDHLEGFNREPIFKPIRDDLNTLLPLVNQASNIELLDLIYQRTKIYHHIAFLENPRARSKKLDFFRQLIASQTATDFFDLINYLSFIEKHDDLDIEYKETKENIAAVKLMSIHQSKGLQFPIIYMLGLHKKFNFQENKEAFNFSKAYGVLTYGNDQGIYRHFLERLHFRMIKNEDISEKIRLLYVALTRAQEEINLVLEAKEVTKQRKISYHNYLEMLYQGFHLTPNDVIVDLIQPPLVEPPKMNQVNQTIDHRGFHFESQVIDQGRYSKQEHHFTSEEEKAMMSYGQNVHEMLEKIDYQDLSSINQLPSFLNDTMNYFINTSLFKSLLAPQFYPEYEFIDEVNGSMRHGFIDLLIEEKDRFIIIDFKLKSINDEQYVDQIKGYQQYLSKITDKKIQGYLYSLTNKELRQVL